MRTFIKVKTPSNAVKGTFHARYISERERDPGREEPESRPLFTRDRDGLKYKAADRYLAGGGKPNAPRNEIQHVIIAFNSHDARELRKLKMAPSGASPAVEHTRRGESANVELSDESANVEHLPGGRDRWRGEELAAAHRAQIAHDRPYAEAVRKMMRNLEESAGLSDLRYVFAVHRHTDKTHVHLLLRRECTDSMTGERRVFHRLPEAFLNGRDEQGKARGGLLDVALSDALDTMIPRRRRAGRTESAPPTDRADRMPDERPHRPEPDDPGTRADEIEFMAPARRDAKPKAKPDKPRPFFASPRAARNAAALQIHPSRDETLPVVATAGTNARDPLPETRPRHAPSADERRPQTTPGRPSDLQNLTTNLQPILQNLKIAASEKPPQAKAYEEALKKKLAARFAQNEQTKTAEFFQQPGTPTKSQLTDSPSEATKTVGQNKSQPTRGR